MISRFLKHYLIAFVAIMIVSVGILVAYTPRIGLEFTGGALTEVRYEVAPSLEALYALLDTLPLAKPLESYALRETTFNDGKAGIMLRTRELVEAERIAIHGALVASDASSTVTRYTAVGSVVGQELIDKAWWAIAAIILSIVLYVAFAFRGTPGNFKSSLFGIVTVAVLVHDLVVPSAALAILGQTAGAEIDTLFVIALLAILGYSVNDTVVIFDRVREELQRDAQKKVARTLAEIVDTATKLTLGRSLNTSMTVVFVLAALYVFGAPVTATFSLIMLIGVLAGTYSSIFIATPLLIALAPKFMRPQEDDAAPTPSV
ncbi:protein-export membrane protein SecF [Candidatus Kaiserbacteria bacterium RIFCSPHIGHO2_02_FULL_50_50]|uniref:Protein translocase subunit SecF n=1 Tax=Candidatus Kaiserbacteria bacterium RIFCSPHIGHO2_02_FULL_50_50 TaxID=1798492 RepID=A0A1F6DDD0_9BACT|nr:MAG: protein-export membrane protein SecF [Candidatus Kaiserbacteria bacterium RIFCSPHIGHO2_02_FULL_50_50]OGG89143.1 MAG: protein-export membrane protein SecF [Candidatus Kaiserbacteria bacterium RIFCSPLOWO2_12_FULL_50_10]